MERNDDFDMDHLIEVAKIAATVAASLGGMAQSVIQSSGLVEEVDECCVIF